MAKKKAAKKTAPKKGRNADVRTLRKNYKASTNIRKGAKAGFGRGGSLVFARGSKELDKATAGGGTH